MALQPGEKYLSADFGKLLFFKNKNKKRPEEPDFYARVPMWLNTKKEPVKTEEVI